jgi:small subunit ribosomal protein S6
MNKYETLFIIKPNLSDDQVEAVVSRLQDRIGRTEGKVAAIDYWGLRRLAYPVLYRGERFRRGYYILLTYVGGGATVEEVERNIKIMDDSFRYLTVKLQSKVDPATIGEPVINRRAEPAAAPPPPPREMVEAAPAPAEPGAEPAPAAVPETAPESAAAPEPIPAVAAPEPAPEPAAAEPAPEPAAPASEPPDQDKE